MAQEKRNQLSDALIEDIENSLHAMNKEELLGLACEAESQFNEGFSLEEIRQELMVYPKEDLVDAVSDSLAIHGVIMNDKGQLMLGEREIPLSRDIDTYEREAITQEIDDVVKSMDLEATKSNPGVIAAHYRYDTFDNPMAWAKGEQSLSLSNGTEITFGQGWSIKEVNVPQGVYTDRSVIEENAVKIRELGQDMHELDTNPTRGRDRDAGMNLGR